MSFMGLQNQKRPRRVSRRRSTRWCYFCSISSWLSRQLQGQGGQGQGVQLYSGTKSNHSISRRRPPVEGKFQSVEPPAKGLRFPGIAGPNCFPEQPARDPIVHGRVIDGVL